VAERDDIDLIARIRLLPIGGGGGTVKDGTRCDVGGLHPSWMKVATLRFLESDGPGPGQMREVGLKLMSVEDIRTGVTPGTDITLQFGPRVFGAGKVTDVSDALMPRTEL